MTRSTRLWASFLLLLVASSAVAAKLDDGTLIFNNSSSAAKSSYTLRKSGGDLVIVDDATNAVLAHAEASQVERVIVRGMPGAHDDTFNIDLSAGFAVRRGIDFDGGKGGFDSLNIRGGAATHTASEARTPNAGTMRVDGLAVRYANIEPASDTVAAATALYTGTAGNDTVTITSGPGAGEMTISSPSFESQTFSNKTQVTFDGGGGTDTFSWNAGALATNLTTFIVTNVDSVTQTTGITVPSFAASALTGVTLINAGNDVSNFEAQSVNDAIRYHDANSFTVGGVTPSMSGAHVTTDGSVLLDTAAGSITLGDSDGVDMVSSGSTFGGVSIQALGATSDVTVSVDNDAITSPAGSITVFAGRDVKFGTGGADFDNDVRANSLVSLNAGRTVQIDGFSDIASDDFGQDTGGNAIAHGALSVLISMVNGTDASFGSNGNAQGSTTLQTNAGGTVTLTEPSTAAAYSASGFVTITTDHLVIDPASGVTAGAEVDISPALTSGNIDVGSTTDVAVNTVEVSDAEVDRVFSPTLGFVANGTITVTQPITFNGAALAMVGTGTFTKAGTGSLDAPELVFFTGDAAARTFTVTPTDVTVSPGAAIPYANATLVYILGGTGGDTFNITPSATTAIQLEGLPPGPPVGDSLNVNIAGATSPALFYTTFSDGYSGAYSFGNRQPVTFKQIEALSPSTTDVSIVKTDGSASETPGTAVQYTITVTELSGFGTSVTVADTFPITLSNVTWSCTPTGTGSTCTSNGVGNINDTGTIAANGTLVYTVNATVSASATGTLDNTANVGVPAGTTDSNPGNNSSTDSDTLVASADLSITKTVDNAAPKALQDVTYTITVSNAGPSDALTVDVSDTIPAGATLVSATPSQGSCAGDPAVVCNLGTLAASANATITIVVTAQDGASFTNSATVTSPTDTTPGNNAASAPVVTVANPVPALSTMMLLLLMSLLGAAAVIALKR